MNQITLLTATDEPFRVESNSPLPISSNENHGASHSDCDRTCGKPGTGAKESHKTSLHGLKSALIIQALVIGILLVISLCMQHPNGSLTKGIQRRRLAGWGGEGEGDGDETGPPSPDFTEFCLELGAWSPSSPSPGDPRASPTLVDSFFQSLDQSAEQSPEQAPAFFGPLSLRELLLAKPKAGEKRSLDDGDLEEEAVAGPSSKVAKTSQAPSISREELAAAAGVTPRQVPENSIYSQHAFARIPTLDPDVVPRPFSVLQMQNPYARSRYYFSSLNRMRELLLLDRLGSQEANEMMLCAQVLANHGYNWMRSKFTNRGPSTAVMRLGHRFMVMSSLYRASLALDQDWSREQWWKDLMDKMPHVYWFNVEMDPRADEFGAALANKLSFALQALRHGEGLSSETLVTLTRELICKAESPLSEHRWDPWRLDDARSSRSSPRRPEGGLRELLKK